MACLEQLGRKQEAMQVCDNIIERFGNETHRIHDDCLGVEAAIVDDSFARALLMKGIALKESGRAEESRAVLQRLCDRFHHDGTVEIVNEALAILHNGKQSPEAGGTSIGMVEGPLGTSSEERTTRVRMLSYLAEDGERFLQIPGWGGNTIETVRNAGIDITAVVGQFDLEFPYRSLEDRPDEFTAVDLYNENEQRRMVQEFVGHIIDRARIAELVNQRLGPEASKWTIRVAHILKRTR
jgi:hypothetical protein